MSKSLFENYSTYLKNKDILYFVDKLRKKIKSLSPNIKESFRSCYISYKLDKCFVYIWFSKNNFWVYFKTNSKFKDNKGLCEDVPKGVTATFDKRIKVNNQNFTYVLFLIKQSYSIVKNEQQQ